MLTWLRNRRDHRPRPAILQSSAVGLIHFPTASVQPAPGPGANRPRLRNFRPNSHDGVPPDSAEDPFPYDELPGADLPRPRRIVVGVTHDPATRNALRWAARAALSGDATLVVVTAYNVPCPIPTMFGWAYVDQQVADDVAQFTQRNVLHDELRGELLTERVRHVVARGDPASVLVTAAKHADLLVVGRREGRHRLSIARSVSKGCMQSAECPVVVVRSDLCEEPLSASSICHLLAPTDGHLDVVNLR